MWPSEAWACILFVAWLLLLGLAMVSSWGRQEDELWEKLLCVQLSRLSVTGFLVMWMREKREGIFLYNPNATTKLTRGKRLKGGSVRVTIFNGTTWERARERMRQSQCWLDEQWKDNTTLRTSSIASQVTVQQWHYPLSSMEQTDSLGWESSRYCAPKVNVEKHFRERT